MSEGAGGAGGGRGGRPEALWPLFAGLESLRGIGPAMAKRLEGIGARTPRDLLLTLPQGVIDRRPVRALREVVPPAVATIEVMVLRHQPSLKAGGPWRVLVEDAERAGLALVYFHARGERIEGLLPRGARRLVSGRVELFDGMAQMVHPDHVLPPEGAASLPAFEPVYPLAAGLTQRGVSRAVAASLARAPDPPEWIDPPLKAREGWPSWREAVLAAHAPQGAADLSPAAPARRRLAYDELLAHQLTLALARRQSRRGKGRPSVGTGRLQRRVLEALPFRPTNAQLRAMAEIAGDMGSGHRMHRLLQGDVGSGKTLVAFLALLVAVESGGQGVMMAPTEILARQHLSALRPLAERAGVAIALLTGRDRGAEREAKRAALASGAIQVALGTHAVFQPGVAFADLRLAVIDEQHRFGVRERLELGSKGRGVDVLVMTATPIPRSLALTRYGDLDVSVLDEKPPGRQPIRTALVADARMGEVVDRLRRAVAEGRRAYWVCPLVEGSERVDLAAAEARAAHLRGALGERVVGLVHGQMPPPRKDAAMADFTAGRTQVLVATTVIEVGVDVPEATIMVIERAETFGLAQLHQLRGRVGRGAEASTCLLLFRAPLSESARRRLQALRDTEDGFRLAEEDLALRGAGDLIGTAQSGLPRFRIADLERHGALMAVAQSDARKLLHDDPGLAGPRGQAARGLLWLMEQDKAIGLLAVG